MQKANNEVKKKQPTSKMRRIYISKLIGRCVIFVLSIVMFFFKPEWFDVINGKNFFNEFSPLHILWVIWMIDMIQQIMPVKVGTALGSQKLFKKRYKQHGDSIDLQKLKEYVITSTKSAYKVFIIWGTVILLLGILYKCNVLSSSHLLLISIAFYVCDLICVLVWCPFRLLMKNRCCTTCRIFNWDHLMMFTPMLFVNSFYSVSLLIPAFVVWVIWETFVMMYPERFFAQTNETLRCSECTDKLCTQYCRKCRK